MVNSIKELREKCQRNEAYRGTFLDSVFFRSLSIYLTKLFLRTSITANQVTILWFLIGIVACYFFTLGNSFYSLVGSMLWYMSYLLDHVDGEISRYRLTTGTLGQQLEKIFHSILDRLIFISIAFGVYMVYPSVWIYLMLCIILASPVILFLFGRGHSGKADCDEVAKDGSGSICVNILFNLLSMAMRVLFLLTIAYAGYIFDSFNISLPLGLSSNTGMFVFLLVSSALAPLGLTITIITTRRRLT